MTEAKNRVEGKNRVEMVVNYVPGEECRVAVMENGNLEEFHAERADAISHVGNIYVGRVTNVEPSIQAAFVDFGLEANGFLHVSDVHPQYFPGEDDDTTERVGKKTPRRERPPIQECFRRGDEVAVQVLKEGVGSKGPTVTSYLSIPGRFLVMMPKMDRVGVSRKVEDEEQRRKMREILDQLELPEGFGFIVRTAGMERTKTELKRDLAYLQRLWKDMEKRWKKGNKPRLLYSESDLLVRALRDMLTSEVDRIVIDNEQALGRASRFLKIVAPRSSTKLLRYKGASPIFHAMGVEQQIRNMYAREVPLPSGGRLVIDETEALVAIDVNSGKMRDARDAETNAYRTNMEAADEICRQLRLRDLGGIVINDLIDMRSLKHRRELEAKFKDNLKKDRARTTLEQISEFGILEMTRQRMRGSHESVHFGDCPMCRGRGLVQKPESVATDAMRELATLLQSPRVVRIEMVVSPRIAGELLSSKRKALTRVERTSGKHVDVRISEAVPVDRVTFYCYDERGADLDVARLEAVRAKPEEFEECDITPAPGDDWAADLDGAQDEPEPVEPEAAVEIHDPLLDGFAEEPEANDEATAPEDETGGRAGRSGGRGRRRRRGGRGANDERAGGVRDDRRGGRDRGGARSGGGRAEPAAGQVAAHAHEADEGNARMPGTRDGAPSSGQVDGQIGSAEGSEGGGRRRRRRRRGRAGMGGGGMNPAGSAGASPSATPILDPVLLAASGDGPKVLEPSSWDVTPAEAGLGADDASTARGSSRGGDPARVEDALAFQSDRDEAKDEPASPPGDGPGSPGAPSDPDAPAQGGERRGRRRRRRRGGRGGTGGMNATSNEGSRTGAGASADVAADEPAPSDDRAPDDEVGSIEPGVRRQAEGTESPLTADESDSDLLEASGPSDAGAGESGAEPAGGGRKRRRRRRGRGGRGGEGREAPVGSSGDAGQNSGGDGSGAGGSASSETREARARESGRDRGAPRLGGGDRGGERGPERSGRGGRGGRGGDRGAERRGGGGNRDGGNRDGGNRGSPNRADANQPRESGGQSRPSSEGPATSTGAAAGTPPAGIKPVRVLYSSRRKLAPSEIKKIKPE